MRSARIRPAVLRLLVERGPLTTPELAAADPALRPGSLARLLLVWLEDGLVERTRDPWTGPGAAPWRYRITERGRAVLAGDEAWRKA